MTRLPILVPEIVLAALLASCALPHGYPPSEPPSSWAVHPREKPSSTVTLTRGMAPDAVRRALGDPTRIDQKSSANPRIESWTYVREVKGPKVVRMMPEHDWGPTPMVFDENFEETVKLQFTDDALTDVTITTHP